MPYPNDERWVEDIYAERARQDRKWGEQNHPPCEWMTILTEEVGEACEAALTIRFGGATLTEDDYRNELVQVAAVAVSAIQCLDRGKWRDGGDDA